MDKMEQLKQQARETAKMKGHLLGRFRESVITSESKPKTQRPAAVADCKICGALIVVDPNPLPGEEEISGAVVNLACSGIDDEGHEMA